MHKVLFMLYHLITVKILIIKKNNKTYNQNWARKLIIALIMGRRVYDEPWEISTVQTLVQLRYQIIPAIVAYPGEWRPELLN